ncbi:MAG: type II toxin-antitoxin system CcdA family antitoxin [Alphaproteobacteria bacterium]|nr:type II toxin-antitoxin system CcdA family antitoxin [Alphaproteobacteria bacterium]
MVCWRNRAERTAMSMTDPQANEAPSRHDAADRTAPPVMPAKAGIQACLWIQENRAAIDAWNAYIEQHGVPLSEFRQF